MKTISKLLLISSLAFGCASTQAGGKVADLRGAVAVHGPSVKAVAVGPADIHAYSEFAGGTIYTAPVVTGGDDDCRVAGVGHTVLEADRVSAVRIEAGQVACLSTVKKGSFELLWHARESKAEPMAIASARPAGR